ncbi:MAG: DUF4149 domain-containing protein [Terriglobales bacterium]
MTFVRFLMLLALVVWVGGIIFFAFVVAPALFTVLPSRELAGTVVQRSLKDLHWIGVGCGAVFLVCSLLDLHSSVARVRNAAVALMLVLTLISQVAITGRMQRLHAAMGIIDAVPATDARRVQFDSLHQWSTALEGLVLLFGLAALYDTTRSLSRRENEPATSATGGSA